MVDFRLALNGCGGGGSAPDPIVVPPPASALFTDVTATHVPATVANLACMDARAFDYDNDGHLDLLLAIEFGRMVLLRNDGTGRFADVSAAAGMLDNQQDHEAIAVADLDGDGDLDFVVASEDTAVHEVYINQGNTFVGRQLPVTSVANAVVAFDFDHDGDKDLIFGGRGLLIMVNDGRGNFATYSGSRIPAVAGVIQDLVVVDVDNDGDLDLAVGVEGQNRLFINDGSGQFQIRHDASAGRLRWTRVLAFADVNRDGYLDMFVGNVQQELAGAVSFNFLYLNDRAGRFVATSSSLGAGTYGAIFVDFDKDGSPDLVTANANILAPNTQGDFQLYRNSGGSFASITDQAFGRPVAVHGFGVASGDFNKDGKADLYLCARSATGSGPRVGGQDRLMLQN